MVGRGPATAGALTALCAEDILDMRMSKTRFLTTGRRRWLARSFQGLFLIAAAGAAGEAFLKLPLGWRGVVVGVLVVSFLLGLYFATAETNGERGE